MKTWTYNEITAKTESQIQRLIEQATLLGNAGSYSEDYCKHRAYGIFIAWDSITNGWQKYGDKKRLECLVNGEAHPQ